MATGFTFGATPATPAAGGFNFGGTSTPAPAPTFGATPAPAAGGFNFGGTSTPAPAPTFGATPAPAAGGFNFGGTSTPAPAPTFGATPAPAAGGFNFGGTSTPAPAPAPAFGAAAAPAFGAVPAPATGGFNFGGTTPAPAPAFGAAPAPTFGITPAPAAGGFNFGGSTPAPAPAFGAAPAPTFGATPAPAAGGFNFGGTTPAAAPTFGAQAGGFNFGGTTPAAAPTFGAQPPAAGGLNFAQQPSLLQQPGKTVCTVERKLREMSNAYGMAISQECKLKHVLYDQNPNQGDYPEDAGESRRPLLVVGFEDKPGHPPSLRKRLQKLQTDYNLIGKMVQQALQMKEELKTLSRKNEREAMTIRRTNTSQRKKLVQIMKQIQQIQGSGYPLQNGEMELKNQLVQMTQKVQRLKMQVTGAEAAVQESRQGDGTGKLSKEELSLVFQVLNNQKEGLAHLVTTLKKDERDLAIMNRAL